jgi:hypothetical protein
MVSRGLSFAETPTAGRIALTRGSAGGSSFSHRPRALITRLPARHYPIRAYLILHPQPRHHHRSSISPLD